MKLGIVTLFTLLVLSVALTSCVSTEIVDGYARPVSSSLATLDFARERQMQNSGAVDGIFIDGRYVANISQGNNVRILLDAPSKHNICYSTPRLCKGRFYEPGSGQIFEPQRYCYKACYEIMIGGIASCRGFEQVACDAWDAKYSSQPTLLVNDK